MSYVKPTTDQPKNTDIVPVNSNAPAPLDREEDGGCMSSCCGAFLAFISIILICVTFPFSLCFVIKQIQVTRCVALFWSSSVLLLFLSHSFHSVLAQSSKNICLVEMLADFADAHE